MLEAHAVVVVAAVLTAEVEDVEVVLGIADDGIELLEDEEREIAVVKHRRFFAQGLTVACGQLKADVGPILFLVFGEFSLLESQLAHGSVRTPPVGTTIELHLEEPQIEAQLEFRFSIISTNEPDVYLSGFKGPSSKGFHNIHLINDAVVSALTFH